MVSCFGTMSEQKHLTLPAVLTVKQLADALDQPVTAVIGKLMGFGVLATINEDIDFDTAAIVADDFGVRIEREETTGTKVIPVATESATLDLRPAIVTIMGHVDHGKTTLLDTIRSTNVASGEAGGITQAISSYQISVSPKAGGEKRTITFLDTPGHSAFEAMRRHGAQITDLVVLVVAADDGIKPQTIEAIRHARELRVPILVALNKMDKPDADPERVKAQLAEHDLSPEEWGGSTVVVPVSAKSGTGIEDLLEMILLATDIRELKANFSVPGVGVVIESQMRPGIGAVATVLVQNGVLRTGDYVAIGTVSGRVRTLTDHRGKKIDEAGPSTPTMISGLSAVPNFGDQMVVFFTEKEARESARQSLRGQGAKRAHGASRGLQVSGSKEGNKTILNVVLKADTNGSLEAVRAGLLGMRNDDVEVRIVSEGIGDIAEGDVTMAKTAQAIVLGFTIRMGAAMKTLADREKVSVSLYTVVYELFDDVRSALAELMPMQEIEKPIGELKILARFNDNRRNVVVGGEVREGVMEAKHKARVIRGKEVVAEGRCILVRRGKDIVRSIQTGSQCGVELDVHTGAAAIAVGDTVSLYTIVQERKVLGL
jgi:translation initiation factor IF-2